jgi:DNA-binding CsgD family transcriptional regulator
MEGRQREDQLLSTYRPKIDPELRVEGQDETILDPPAARNGNAIQRLLTPREAEIARFVAEGLSNKHIARKASISEATVKIHLHNAYQKLGIANRSTLAVMVSLGLLPSRDEEDHEANDLGNAPRNFRPRNIASSADAEPRSARAAHQLRAHGGRSAR